MESHESRAGVGVGLVGRVRQFLMDYAEARDPSGAQRDDPFRVTRLVRARREGRMVQDLDELERRLRRLRRAYPELGDVEVNPLLRSARSYLDSPEDDEISSVGGERLGIARWAHGDTVRSFARRFEGR